MASLLGLGEPLAGAADWLAPWGSPHAPSRLFECRAAACCQGEQRQPRVAWSLEAAIVWSSVVAAAGGVDAWPRIPHTSHPDNTPSGLFVRLAGSFQEGEFHAQLNRTTWRFVIVAVLAKDRFDTV